MYQEIIKLSTKTDDFIDITPEVGEIVEKSGIKDGLCLVFNIGSTGSVIINEYETRLLNDFKETLEKITSGKHMHPSNAHSHLRAGLLGPGKVISIENGQMQLGTWQSIIFCEFDVRPRDRRILVTVIGDNK